MKENLNQINISAGDDAFTTKSGIVNLHPTKGTQFFMFVDKFHSDPYGCPPPVSVVNQNKRGIYPEYQNL